METRVHSCHPESRRPGVLSLGLTAALAAAPLPLLAECLTQGDLAKGLRATYLDGSVVDYRSGGQDVVEVTEIPDPKAPQALRFRSRYGIYDLSAQGLMQGVPQAGQVLDYTYSDPEGAEPPRPDPGKLWLGHSTTTYADGSSDSFVAVMVYGTEGTLRLGDCDYATVPVTVSYLAGESWSAQDYEWLSDLGIGLLTRREGSDAARPSAYRITGLGRALP